MRELEIWDSTTARVIPSVVTGALMVEPRPGVGARPTHQTPTVGIDGG